MSRHLGYLPKLDALRAIAALLVMCSHYFVEVHGPRFGYGGNGVQIFFVISGFLITTILLAQKERISVPKIRLVGNFIMKRALRLFPVYYLLLIFLFIISMAGGLWICAKADWWHYFTYTQNYLFLKKGFQSELLNHTWSLAVEEQFYLFWPFLILFIPRRAEVPVLLTVFLGGIITKYYFVHYYVTPGTVKGVTFIHFDTLGAGALLAWCMHNGIGWVKTFFDKAADLLFLIGLISSGLLTYFRYFDAICLPMSLVIMSIGLVYMSTYRTWSLLDPLLNNRIMQRIGKVSYGVYLYHKLVPFFFNYIYKHAHLPEIHNGIFLFLIYFTVTMIVAAISWNFFESKVLMLKERFDL